MGRVDKKKRDRHLWPKRGGWPGVLQRRGNRPCHGESRLPRNGKDIQNKRGAEDAQQEWELKARRECEGTGSQHECEPSRTRVSRQCV